MLITDRTGSFVALLDRNRMLKSADYRENELIKFLAANTYELGAVTRRIEALKEGNRISTIATGVPIDGTDWVALAETPESEAYAEASANTQKILMFAFGLLLLALGAGTVYSYRLARPMAQLAESVREISAGNESIELPCGHDSEAGVVAKVFREMSDQARQNFANLKLAVEDSKQLLTGILRALASAIDAKDPYTRGHSERVTRFATEIAKIMNLPEEDIERIKLAALIHDVGKIGIDDRVLKKPGALSDEEFRVMKTHTTCGYEMMKHIPQLKDILPGIHSHHEHLNGKGYPRGLKGNEIPMIARVIMVADCFDAMTTKRPHQDPAPIDQVLAEIRSLSGKSYDEKAVEALVRGVKTGQIIPYLAT
jgi:HD-GYP domain-containing protein (c-di-GMP phosphodiesterase class II)